MESLCQYGMAGASSAAMLYSYNRASWISDTRRKSSRRIHVHAVLFDQATLFRDDIKELCTAATVKQRNYVAVATIFLGMAGTCYVNKPLPRETPLFLVTAYRQCVGSAFYYLVLAVLCGMAAIHMATRCQRDMLLTRVRLPVDDLLRSLKDSSFAESIEAFEHQGFRTILRIPGASFLRKLVFRRCPARKPGRRAVLEFPSGSLEDMADAHHEAHFCMNSLREMEERQAQHLDVFFKQEREWILCGQQAILLASLGMGHLLEAFGIISIAQYYSGDVWTSWTVGIKVTLGNLVTAVACGRYLNLSWRVLLAESAFILAGPLACSTAVLPNDVKEFSVSAMFLCRTLINAIALHKLSWLSPASGPPPKPNFSTAHHARGLLLEPEEDTDEVFGLFAVPHQRQSANLDGSTRSTKALVVSSSVVMISWLLCFLWAVHHQVTRTTEFLMCPQQF